MGKYQIGALVLILLLGMGLPIALSEDFKSCVGNQGQYPTTQNGENEPTTIRPVNPSSAWVVVSCLSGFANENGEAITGLATIFLAFVTGGLVWLGHEQSKTARAQLRAYLSVSIGGATYQERTKELRFAARPMIANTGQTPAYKVSYEIRADIIPDNLASGYSFTPPSTGQTNQSSIGPRETRLMTGIVQNFVPDSEVQDIKDGNGRALWVWGVVHYEDVFGRTHFTEFCQRMHWIATDQIYGIFDPRFGNSD